MFQPDEDFNYTALSDEDRVHYWNSYMHDYLVRLRKESGGRCHLLPKETPEVEDRFIALLDARNWELTVIDDRSHILGRWSAVGMDGEEIGGGEWWLLLRMAQEGRTA